MIPDDIEIRGGWKPAEALQAMLALPTILISTSSMDILGRIFPPLEGGERKRKRNDEEDMVGSGEKKEGKYKLSLILKSQMEGVEEFLTTIHELLEKKLKEWLQKVSDCKVNRNKLHSFIKVVLDEKESDVGEGSIRKYLSLNLEKVKNNPGYISMCLSMSEDVKKVLSWARFNLDESHMNLEDFKKIIHLYDLKGCLAFSVTRFWLSRSSEAGYTADLVRLHIESIKKKESRHEIIIKEIKEGGLKDSF